MCPFNPLKKFRMADLPCADLNALAAVLESIYPERSSVKLKLCFIQYIPNLPSFIIINAAEQFILDDNPREIFSVCTEQQAVIWEARKHASIVTPVPQHLQPFLRRLTDQVHGIAAKQTEGLELKRKREEDEKKYRGANVEKRRKRRRKEEEEAEKEKEEEKDETEKEKEEEEEEAEKEKEEEEEEVEKEEVQEEEEAEKERKEKAAKIELRRKIGRRKNELNFTSRVMKWKASPAYLTVSIPNEQQTAADKMLELAKRGPEHDLCEDCGETLRLCKNKNCTIIGCIKCFEAELTVCFSCTEFVCKQHWKECSGCIHRFCDIYRYGEVCDCGEFMCNTCCRCGTCGVRYPWEKRDPYKLAWP